MDRPLSYETLTSGLSMWRDRRSFFAEIVDHIDLMAATLALTRAETQGLLAQREVVLDFLLVCDQIISVLTRARVLWRLTGE